MNKKIKAILNEPRKIQHQETELKEKVEILKSRQEGTAQIFDGMPKGKGGKKQGFEKYTYKIIEFEKELERLQNVKRYKRALAIKLISTEPNENTRRIITRHYIKLEKWRDIANDENYSYSYIRNINTLALAKMEKNTQVISLLESIKI